MKVDGYDLDSLRKLVRNLQAENKELRALLKNANIPCGASEAFADTPTRAEEYDLDQGARILPQFIDRDLAKKFFSRFWGREDVFAKRAKNGNYYPQCDNRWDDKICPKQRGEKVSCEECAHTRWTKLRVEHIISHLVGRREDGADVIGVYPLLAEGTCRFLVFDFDNHEKEAERTDFANEDNEWLDEVDALRSICRQNDIDALVERSRSGRGAHVWILFQNAIPASLARNFGFLLLDKGAAYINLKSFRYYDRMYPSQDAAQSIGNLIALPLQGQALKQGNSAFVDGNWNAYPDQWKRLLQTKRLSQAEVEAYIARWQAELGEGTAVPGALDVRNRPRPWKRQNDFAAADVVGKMHIVLADGVYVDALNLKPRLQNQLRCMAAFDNPVYYKNKRLGYSNYYQFSTIYMGADIDGYIKVPRGLLENILAECEKSQIACEIEDQREGGRPIRVAFRGELRMQQDLAAQRLLAYDNGILSAATAFGKTVVCSYLIAKRGVNTLILLENTDLIAQWKEELERFLQIDEDPPEYRTKTGRVKKHKSVIGILKGGKDTLTGIVDIAMIGSLYKRGAFHEKLNSYGMVILDECHHAASATAQELLKKINAKYVYGVSATPVRSDNLEKINYMLLGPIRHKYTALERAEEQGIGHYVRLRYTRAVNLLKDQSDINEAYGLICNNENRNQQMIDDIQRAVENGRTPVVLTRYKEHARFLYERVKACADFVFLLYGDNSARENEEIRKRLLETPREKSMVLVATGQKIGEGFNCPRLDTLMLAAPISSPGRLEQYVGRLNRDYPGKTEVIVYDYVDSHIPVFQNMYLKRLRTYKKIGFGVLKEEAPDKQEANAIYDSGNYLETFERDLVEARRQIVICSPHIARNKTERLIALVKPIQERGVQVTVITADPENTRYESADYLHFLVEQLKEAGIHVKLTEDETEHFAVLDELLVWHGGMNLLGRPDAWDNLIRVEDCKAAAELLERADL